MSAQSPLPVLPANAGFGSVADGLTQWEVTMAESLSAAGYATALYGKWHLGSHDGRLPNDQGFDYFYGFNQGETNQWYPVLYRNTASVAQPRSPEQGYHFTADMTDEAIAWIRNTRAAAKDKPWFVYYSAPAAHAPHHAPQEWRDQFKGKFDHGWDKQREITFAQQKKLGVIPANTKLTPQPKEIPAWDDQPADAKRVYTRLMENYAGYLAFADDEIGRRQDCPAAEISASRSIYPKGKKPPTWSRAPSTDCGNV
jgi:arylsulfatase A-like enzyme